MYELFFKKSAVKELGNVPSKDRLRIFNAVRELADEPHPVGHKKLVGSDCSYRIRVGNYRVIYNIYDKQLTIEIVRVRHRKDAYR